MARTVTDRFVAWVSWLKASGAAASQDAVSKRIDCSQAMVSKLLAGERVHRIDLAKRIERESAEWPDGPIVVDEWHEGPAADSGNNPERAAS